MLQKNFLHKEERGFKGHKDQGIYIETTKSEQKIKIAICFSES
jgi:hypothetical protein